MRSLVALFVTLPLLGLEPAPDVTGTWTVQDLHYAPWILNFRGENGEVKGTVQLLPPAVGVIFGIPPHKSGMIRPKRSLRIRPLDEYLRDFTGTNARGLRRRRKRVRIS